MEDVLEVYQRPYDPARPVVCLDEKSKELHATPRGSSAPRNRESPGAKTMNMSAMARATCFCGSNRSRAGVRCA